MPKLPQFQANVGDLPISGGRRATAEDAGGGIGEALGGVATAARSFHAGVENAEARTALVESSAVRAKYAKKLDEAALTGGDLEKLKEEMNNELTKVGEGFATRHGQDSLALYTSNTNLMYDQQANAIAVRRAGAEARMGAQKFLTSTAVILQGNQSYLPVAEKDADALVETFANISPEQRKEIAAELKNQLNMTAALASARGDAEGTKRRLEAGEWNLTGTQREQAINNADSEIRARRANEAYQRAEQQRRIQERDDESRDTHFASIIGGTATRRAIMDDPNLRPATREHLINVMEHRAKELNDGAKKSDPLVERDLAVRILAPDNDPRKIYNGDAIFQALDAGKINVDTANKLNAMVANQRDENNRTIGSKLGGMMQVVGRALSADPQFTQQPALVAEIQMDYQARVYEKVQELRDAKKNPNEAFNPASKDYVGSREFIQGSIDQAKTRQRGAAMQPGHTVKRDGVDWEYIGGDPKLPASWRPAESELVKQIPR